MATNFPDITKKNCGLSPGTAYRRITTGCRSEDKHRGAFTSTANCTIDKTIDKNLDVATQHNAKRNLYAMYVHMYNAHNFN